MTLLALALVGTDHHPIERCVDLIDGAALWQPQHWFLVQHGVTRRTLTADGPDYLTRDDLLAGLGDCDLAVCHAGLATIMDARSRSHLPICIREAPGWASTPTVISWSLPRRRPAPA